MPETRPKSLEIGQRLNPAALSNRSSLATAVWERRQHSCLFNELCSAPASSLAPWFLRFGTFSQALLKSAVEIASVGAQMFALHPTCKANRSVAKGKAQTRKNRSPAHPAPRVSGAVLPQAPCGDSGSADFRLAQTGTLRTRARRTSKSASGSRPGNTGRGCGSRAGWTPGHRNATTPIRWGNHTRWSLPQVRTTRPTSS